MEGKITLKPGHGCLWICWHKIKSSEPVSEKKQHSVCAAFQLVTLRCCWEDTLVSALGQHQHLLTGLWRKQLFTSYCPASLLRLAFKMTFKMSVLKLLSNDLFIEYIQRLCQGEIQNGIVEGNRAEITLGWVTVEEQNSMLPVAVTSVMVTGISCGKQSFVHVI